MTKQGVVSISEILIRGGEVLASSPNFRLVGRDQELHELFTTLMKMRKSNLIVTGLGGVGVSAIVKGIQASKKDLTTPVDIVGKRFYWINTDKLFESGATQVISQLFEKVRQTLKATKNSVIVFEDTVDFIKSAQSHGCTHLINGLMGDLKSRYYQAIFETRDDTLGEILKCDGDIQECCTLYEVKEPQPENLRLILKEATKDLELHHGIKITESGLNAAALLTEKYKISELRAQPDAALSLLDRAFTDLSLHAHAQPFHIEQIKQEILSLESSLSGKSYSKEYSKEKLQSLIVERNQQLQRANDEWVIRQKEVRVLYKDISDGEEEIRKLQDSIERIREEQISKAEAVEVNAQQNESDTKKLGTLTAMMSDSQYDTKEISDIKSRIQKLNELVSHATENYKKKVAEVYAGLTLEETHVMRSFSALSGIPVDKLNEDERVRLKELEQILSKRVIGQEEPVLEVSKAVKRARLGLKMPNKPSGTFMFLGPSGVGKTELAKALAEALQVPLLRFDMSEYMEKHAVAKLIGAPPGYEGYEHGGVLTNSVRRNPYSVVLFDEIEKAHLDVFNLMLQVLDDARLTDSRGLTASFKDTIIIMTTNIGTPHFLDEQISFEESKSLALTDLRSQYKPEFLGRFGGNIYCFKRLGDAVLTAIAKKDIARINSLIAERKIYLTLSDDELAKLIKGSYVPREGARSILGFIDRHVTSGIAEVVLGDTPVTGEICVSFDVDKSQVKLSPKKN